MINTWHRHTNKHMRANTPAQRERERERERGGDNCTEPQQQINAHVLSAAEFRMTPRIRMTHTLDAHADEVPICYTSAGCIPAACSKEHRCEYSCKHEQGEQGERCVLLCSLYLLGRAVPLCFTALLHKFVFLLVSLCVLIRVPGSGGR